MIDQVPAASSVPHNSFRTMNPGSAMDGPVADGDGSMQLVRALARMAIVSADQPVTLVAAGRRRLVRRLSRRPAGQGHLRQARAAQAQGRRRLARAGRTQSLGGRVDAHCRAPSCPQRFPKSSARIARPAVSRWRILPPDAVPGLEGIARGTGLADLPTATAVGDCARPDSRRNRRSPRYRRRGFPTDGIFHAIRLEPYLVATARAHRRSRAAARRARRRRRSARSGCSSTATSARRTC